MQPIPQRVLNRKPTLSGVACMVEWWNGYDQPVRAQRLRVTEVCKTFTDEDRKRIQVYMHSRLRAFDTSVTGQASTSTAPLVPVFQVVLDPEENAPCIGHLHFQCRPT